MRGDRCAVDITGGTAQVMVQRSSGSAEAVDLPLPADVVQDGQITQPDAVRTVLLRLFRSVKAHPTEVLLTLTDRACVTRFLDYPTMPRAEVAKSIPVEAERELPMDVGSVYLDWEVLEAHETGQTVLLVGAWRDAVDSYVNALQRVGHVTVAEPRSFALARAAGLPDAVLADWTGDQLQVVVVDQRRVRFTATALVSATVRNSPMRLAQAFCTLIPRPGIGRRLLPKQIVFLGELYGRNDVAAFVQRQPMSQSFEIMTDWLPPDPFRRFVAAGQTANMGLLLRN